MKKFLGFLVDLFVILLELAICAFLVFWLISKCPPCPPRPESSIRSIPTPTPVPTWDTRSIGPSTPTTPLPGKLGIPPVFWIPKQFAPEKQWGYDRVYSCTRLERVSGFWHIPGSRPPMSPYFHEHTFDESAILCF